MAYRAERVAFSYGPRRQSTEGGMEGWALRGVSCDVGEGEILGIIGPNGSGKSTLLKLLGALLLPQQGTIRLQERPLDSFSRQELARIVAYVPQQSSVIFPFTLAEFVLMGRFPHRRTGGVLGGFGWETAEDLRAAGQAMEAMEILHLADRAISDVSGGERQRAFIACALAQAPRVLLLDEPTVFLDLRHQVDICAIMRRLNREQGLTVVWVSHDLNLASQYCDRLLLLQDGALARLGAPSAVLQPEVIESVYRCPVLVDRHPASGVPRVTLP
ncbi:MAG: iron ABC transporter ATP-binding protein [Nitrospirae bacterium RIFCSPLOWO2_02_FULL_62_14]|nr:MAG: iron ABC transporter ATP-binding protein [Nitrospirae bacterium RIFCSPLOWO2_02_FULL_62_14]OGW68977.1 MAG: iron ABC transporter ATP-binding protein [Nitrospirae bacterium RIFCSPLOWO2_01_FULL_62_17]